MKINNYLILILLTVSFLLKSNNLIAKIDNKIAVKVGSEIITSYDIKNQIKTLIFINQQEMSQSNINAVKNIALDSLIKTSLKRSEINKYKISNYSQLDLDNYIKRLATQFNTDTEGFIKIFEQNNINFKKFIEGQKIELIWNTLIFQLYKNQIDINPIEIENDLKIKLKDESSIKEFRLSEIELDANDPDLNKTLNSIYSLIKSEGFENAVKKYSKSNSALKNGDIGWVSNKSLSETFKLELSKIKKGEFTKPIKNTEAIVILKMVDIKNIKNENIDLVKLKNDIIKNKKEQKLKLFSRSHFSNLENSILINFYE
jgi:peptidyl-prolyl cis-trans isomerase SurA|tara:strand:- start:515 stop:1462 length:948 start_codon:yes stop_codon:yes gene_type:complete